MGSASVIEAWEGTWSSGNVNKDIDFGPRYDCDVGYGPGGVINSYEITPLGSRCAVYKISLTLATGETLNSLRVSVRLGHGSTYPQPVDISYMEHQASVTCRLYIADPSNDATAPSGAIGTATKEVHMTPLASSYGYYGTVVDFDFLLSRNVGGTLYARLDATNSMPVYVYQNYGYYVDCERVRYAGLNPVFIRNVLTMDIAESAAGASTGDTLHLSVGGNVGNALHLSLCRQDGGVWREFATEDWTGASGSPRSLTVTADKSWFQLTGETNQSFNVRAILSEPITGGRTSDPVVFTLRAGSDMAPQIGTPTATLVQAESASAYSSTWIAGFSKAKIAAAVTPQAGATLSSVKLSYGGTTVNMTYNSSTQKYEATTAAPLAGNTAFTITATDSRALVGTNTLEVKNVVPYTKPSIALQSLYRTDSPSGQTEVEGGEYYAIQVKATVYTRLSNNRIELLTAGIKNGTATNITDNVKAWLGGLTNPDGVYTIVVSIQDRISEVITREFLVSGAHHDFMLLRANGYTHLGIGMAPSATINGVPLNCDTIQLPSGAKILIGGVEKLS